MKKEPDFYFITGELKDATIYSCWTLGKVKQKNPNISAIFVRINPPFYYDKKVTKVILATTPKDALYPQPKFPEWVTMYKLLKPMQADKSVKSDDVSIIDKGDIFKNISDIPKNYFD